MAKAFWQILDQYGIPNTVFRIPANFPPVNAKGHTFSGMGTPDLRGSYGTFSFYTDDLMATAGPVEGGEIIPVQVKDFQVKANLVLFSNYTIDAQKAASLILPRPSSKLFGLEPPSYLDGKPWLVKEAPAA